MVDVQGHERGPLWVRMAVRKGWRRRTAVGQVVMCALLTGLGLLLVGSASGSSSFLGALALPIGLAGAGLCAAMALWSWLAVLWMDRNSKWE